MSMIVRLKKRGEFPCGHFATRLPHTTATSIHSFKGCCIEVDPPHTHEVALCGSRIFKVTDRRVLALYAIPADRYLGICEHYLIDEVNAFDSDFCDEEAQEGDLVFAQIPLAVQR